MKVGSLCTGIMGAEIAFSMMGLEPELVWYSEIDPHACALLAAKTDAPNLGDLKLINWAQVEPIDALVAGYPCQPFSTAGNRKGTDDPRHLWPWIAGALRVLRPRYAFFENVSGHLSLGFDTVLCDLAEIGFDAEWTTLRASDVGACHQRNRLFIVASDSDAQGLQRPQDRASEAPTRRHGHAQSGIGVDRRDTSFGPYAPAVERWERVIGRPTPKPAIDGRLNPAFVEWMMGYPEGWTEGVSRTGQLKALGNSIVPHQAAAAWGSLMGLEDWDIGESTS